MPGHYQILFTKNIWHYYIKKQILFDRKKIVTFGNQISSIFLDQPISVSQCRRKKFSKQIGKRVYSGYPVYYPVGNGMRNIDKAIADLQFILEEEDHE